MKIIVGLGNPGEKFAKTRHNAGFMVLDRLAHSLHAEFRTVEDEQMAFARVVYQKTRFLMLKPLGMMNNSGRVLAAYLRKRKLKPVNHADLYLVHDDIDLPLGRLKIQPGGGDSTHKGVKSVMISLGFRDFPRFRVGIADDPSVIADKYVLEEFTLMQTETFDFIAARAGQALLIAGRFDLPMAMNQFNNIFI